MGRGCVVFLVAVPKEDAPHPFLWEDVEHGVPEALIGGGAPGLEAECTLFHVFEPGGLPFIVCRGSGFVRGRRRETGGAEA